MSTTEFDAGSGVPAIRVDAPTMCVPVAWLPALRKTARREVEIASRALGSIQGDPVPRESLRQVRDAIDAYEALSAGDRATEALVAFLVAATIDWEAGNSEGLYYPTSTDEADATIARLQMLREMIAFRDAAQGTTLAEHAR